jgi:nucleoside-diphosphate-sugar epimerase
MIPRQNTAFVTGAAGFLGVNLVHELVREGWKVYALHRQQMIPEGLGGLPIESVRGDVTDLDALEKAVPSHVDAIFNLAGVVSYWSKKKREQIEVNVNGACNVAEIARRRKARLIHTSSIVTYDWSQGDVISESTPLNGDKSHVNYIRTKRLGEIEIEKRVAQGLDAVILHPGIIIGAYDFHTWSRLFSIINRGSKVVGIPGGEASMCHARQCARACISTFYKGRRGEHYLIGGVSPTFLELAQETCRILGKPPINRTQPSWLVKLMACLSEAISYISGKEPPITIDLADLMTTRIVCNSEKAIRELGYQPSSLSEMLRDCHQWMVNTERL